MYILMFQEIYGRITGNCMQIRTKRLGCINILVLRNAFEKTRKQMKVNALSINALSDNLNFPMFAELTLKKT